MSQRRTYQGEIWPDAGLPKGTIATYRDFRGDPPEGYKPTKAAGEADHYLARFPFNLEKIAAAETR